MSYIKEEAAPKAEVAPAAVEIEAAAPAQAQAKNSSTNPKPKPKPKQAGAGKKGQGGKPQDSTALMASLTPLMALMAEAAELDLTTGRFRDDSEAAKLTWQRHKSGTGSGSLSGGQRHPLEPTMLELVGLFYLPWATAFISDLDWPEVRELSTQLLEYTGCQELMYVDVALHPVRKYGGLQYYPAPDNAGYGLDLSKLRELCERKNFKMPLTGWHGLALGLACLGYALPDSLRDPQTGEPASQFEAWLWRVPRNKDGQGSFWESPGRWFKPDGTRADHAMSIDELQAVVAEVIEEINSQGQGY
ncbi:MAG TPA: hypothetical protein VH186_15825 [Chloroflexia bacterium]|nr:hypothetical protein [Chloroflexia bacterium]